MLDDCIDHGKKGSGGKYTYTWREGRQIGLHRAVYADKHGLSLGDLDGLVVRHTCDNPRCINPEHLLIGTQMDNIQDMLLRGRKTDRVITDEQVAEIRRRYTPRCPVNGQTAMAKEYGVTQGHLSNIIHKRYR